MPTEKRNQHPFTAMLFEAEDGTFRAHVDNQPGNPVAFDFALQCCDQTGGKVLERGDDYALLQAADGELSKMCYFEVPAELALELFRKLAAAGKDHRDWMGEWING